MDFLGDTTGIDLNEIFAYHFFREGIFDEHLLGIG